MKSFFLFLTILIYSPEAIPADIFDEIAQAVQNGNSALISRYFAGNVDLKILSQENIYSKAQAELILRDFFTKHPPAKFSIAHKSTLKNDSQFAIGTLETKKGKFRVNFVMKTTASSNTITQFRIEPEDE
ncbi:MAG: DUF4783 domain-containing protein [Bacteroidia bacterium]